MVRRGGRDRDGGPEGARPAVGSSAGLRVELRAATTLPEPTGIQDWELCVPGALYKRNDTDHDGVEDYFSAYAHEFRDDRLPSLAVLAYLPARGRYVALTRVTPPAHDARLEPETLRRRRLLLDTDIGSLGVFAAGGQIELRAGHPFAEARSFCLTTRGDGWAGHLPNREGQGFDVSYGLWLGTAPSLTDAIWAVTRRQMRVLRTRPAKPPFSLEEALEHRNALTQRCYREWPVVGGGGRPAGYAVHFSPRTGRTLGSLLEYGFSGAQTLLAWASIEHGHRRGVPSEIERARRVIDFFVERCQLPNGFSHGIYDAERDDFVHWFTGILTPFQYARDDAELERYLGAQTTAALAPIARDLRRIAGNYTRTMCESIYPILLAVRSEAGRGASHPDWLAAGERFGAFLLRTQDEDGSWYRAYAPDGSPITAPAAWFGASDTERKSGTIFPIEVLVELFGLTGDERYRRAAERAGDFIVQTFVEPAEYVGGLNDTTHVKSVKTDSVGVMFVLRSLIKLHELTGDPRHACGAAAAARMLASFVFLWDVPFPAGTLLARSRFATTGWAVCDVIAAGSYVDNELLEFTGDLVRTAALARDPDLLTVAEIAEIGMHGGLSTPHDMLGYVAPGIQCEGVLTSYWLSDPDTATFSGAVAKRKGDDNDTCNGLTNGQRRTASSICSTPMGRWTSPRSARC
jgi:hypothetical protein